MKSSERQHEIRLLVGLERHGLAWLASEQERFGIVFDYVVVGEFSYASCAVAARLSEDPDFRVALIESGNEK
jgi:hypothetical protein